MSQAERPLKTIGELQCVLTPVAYTPSGNIDIEKTLWAIRHSHRPDLDLAATLRSVWADAYAHGWSDGQNDADPNVRSNPYGT